MEGIYHANLSFHTFSQKRRTILSSLCFRISSSRKGKLRIGEKGKGPVDCFTITSSKVGHNKEKVFINPINLKLKGEIDRPTYNPNDKSITTQRSSKKARKIQSWIWKWRWQTLHQMWSLIKHKSFRSKTTSFLNNLDIDALPFTISE